MNRTVKGALVLAVIGLLVGGFLFWNRSHSRPAVQVVVHLRVQPPSQLDLVMAQANSARFKYVLGKMSGARPFLAQQLRLEKAPDSAHIVARIGLDNREEAKKYLDTFAAALQDFCGSQVQLTLDEQKIR